MVKWVKTYNGGIVNLDKVGHIYMEEFEGKACVVATTLNKPEGGVFLYRGTPELATLYMQRVVDAIASETVDKVVDPDDSDCPF